MVVNHNSHTIVSTMSDCDSELQDLQGHDHHTVSPGDNEIGLLEDGGQP